MFRSMVGSAGKGHVYAIDITPQFVTFMNQRLSQDQADHTDQDQNVSVSLCTNKSTLLKKDSCDVAFICDGYHHFGYPKTFMKDLNSTMKTNGMLFLIDFYRQPEKMTSHDVSSLLI